MRTKTVWTILEKISTTIGILDNYNKYINPQGQFISTKN